MKKQKKEKAVNINPKAPFSKKAIAAIKLITGEFYLSERSYGKFRKRIIRTARVIFNSIEKFMVDDCFTKASSLAYTLVVSLIPMLAVGFTFLSMMAKTDKDQLFVNIQRWLVSHNLNRLNIDPFLDSISTLIDNSARIGGIGAIVLAFSATAILRTLEHSLNTIWNVKRERNMVLKMVYYWAAITLGPLILIAGTTVATQVQSALSAPNYKVVSHAEDGSVWAVGNKATLTQYNPGTGKFKNITIDQIDFDNQLIYLYDNTTHSFTKDEFLYDEISFKKLEFRDIKLNGNFGIVAGKEGVILRTDNGGEKWRIEKWGSSNFNSIAIFSNTSWAIGSEGGYLLQTENTGESYNLLSWSDVTADINKIAVSSSTGIAVCNRGYIIKTEDAGKTWTPSVVELSRTKKRYVNLNAISLLDTQNGWIAGDEGVILTTSDGFKNFEPHNFLGYSYSAILATKKNEGYAAGEDGLLIHTSDGGATWQKIKFSAGNILCLASGTDNSIWCAGSAGLLLYGNSITGQWKGEKGTGLIVYFLSFFAPFIFVWVAFLLIYQMLPNIKVPFKPAAIGASITGTIWVAFILGFIVYVKSFASGTFAVYGALAAFPIFLLLIYASAVIILFGAEVSYMLVNLDSYIRQKRLSNAMNKFSVYAGMRIIHSIYKTFELKGGSTEHSEIVKLCERPFEADYYLSLFTKENLLLEREGGGYIPATSSENITIAKLIELIHNADLTVPSTSPDDGLKKPITKVFEDIRIAGIKITGKMTLADCIKK